MGFYLLYCSSLIRHTTKGSVYLVARSVARHDWQFNSIFYPQNLSTYTLITCFDIDALRRADGGRLCHPIRQLMPSWALRVIFGTRSLIFFMP
jgi:hypothetical protein